MAAVAALVVRHTRCVSLANCMAYNVRFQGPKASTALSTPTVKCSLPPLPGKDAYKHVKEDFVEIATNALTAGALIDVANGLYPPEAQLLIRDTVRHVCLRCLRQ